jgi:DNA-directed RNA polymerase omega subunit
MATDQKEQSGLRIDSKYRKILIAAKRSKQLQKGARARVQVANTKPTRIALEEVTRGLVDFEIIPLAEVEEQ